jgi:hypothetical protein
VRTPHLAACLAASLVALPAAAAIDLQPGQWLVGFVIEIPGGRGPNPGKLEQEMCLSPADAKKLFVPPNSPCKISDLRESPGEVSWKVACSQGGMKTRGTGRIEFFGDHFKGTVSTRADPPYEMQVTQHLAGKRLGECRFPKKPPPELKKYEGG